MTIGRLFFALFKAIPAGIQHGGWRGGYLSSCVYLLNRYPFKVSAGLLGCLATYAEVENYVDNIILAQLRDDEIEAHLAATDEPVVLDVGVNVGITVRWWKTLNPATTVVGVDMMQEALDYVTNSLKVGGFSGGWVPVCCAVGAKPGNTVSVLIDDPLHGQTSLYAKSGREKREVSTGTLDEIMASHSGRKHIDLLKLDIEGAAGDALVGAGSILKHTKYVIVETHNRSETLHCSRLLANAGMAAYRASGRMLWFTREP